MPNRIDLTKKIDALNARGPGGNLKLAPQVGGGYDIHLEDRDSIQVVSRGLSVKETAAWLNGGLFFAPQVVE